MKNLIAGLLLMSSLGAHAQVENNSQTIKRILDVLDIKADLTVSSKHEIQGVNCKVIVNIKAKDGVLEKLEVKTVDQVGYLSSSYKVTIFNKLSPQAGPNYESPITTCAWNDDPLKNATCVETVSSEEIRKDDFHSLTYYFKTTKTRTKSRYLVYYNFKGGKSIELGGISMNTGWGTGGGACQITPKKN